MPFEIRRHTPLAIIEVVYPERPTSHDVLDYVTRIRQTIALERGGFGCLVDQRKLIVLPPEMVETVASLNAYAQSRGMLRSARVVAGAIAELQTIRMAREASLKVPARSFESRDAAVAWLTEVLPK